jgi:uncharacterized protein YbjT (DUF2867 family)
MILVVGATGLVGGEICRRLASEGRPARALVRPAADPGKVDTLRAEGAQVVLGDLRDPASLAQACRDATDVILTASSMPFAYVPGVNDIASTDLAGAIDLVNAAKAAGTVRRILYVSLSGNMDLEFPLRDAKRAVENHLRSAGIPFTILRPSYFMEVWLSAAVGFDAANATATIYGTGDNPVSWISLADVAAFAVAAVDRLSARNATLELGGPAALTPHEVIRRFERLAGRSYTVQHVPAEALLAQQQAAADPMQQSFSGLMRCYAQGDAIDMTAILRDYPIPLTTVDAYAARTLGHIPEEVVAVH